MGTSTNGRRRDLRGEADYLPETVEDLVELRRQIIAADYSPSVANGLVGWLLSKLEGDPDTTSSRTRASYRQILAELETAGAGPDGPGRGRHLESVKPAVGADSGEGPESTFC